MDYNKAKIRKTWGVWAQSWLIAHGCLLELISQKKRWSDDRLWLKEQNQSSLPHWGEAARLPRLAFPANSPQPHDITSGCSEFNSALLCQSWQLLCSARLKFEMYLIRQPAHGSQLRAHMLPLAPGPARLAGSSSRSTESEWKLRGRRRAWPGLTRGKDLNAAVPGCCWQLSALSSYERLDGSRGWLGAGRLVHRWCKVFRV